MGDEFIADVLVGSSSTCKSYTSINIARCDDALINVIRNQGKTESQISNFGYDYSSMTLGELCCETCSGN